MVHDDVSARVARVKYSSAVGAGFYGNEETNKGLLHFIEAAEDVRETILRTESQVSWRSTAVLLTICIVSSNYDEASDSRTSK